MKTKIKYTIGLLILILGLQNVSAKITYDNLNGSFRITNNKVFGVCGNAHGQETLTAPTTDLCTSGNASIVSGSGPWDWTCTGENGGTDAQCSANKKVVSGQCGISQNKNFLTAPTNDLCLTGTPTSVISNGLWEWNCNGVNGGTDIQCSAKMMIHGECGSSNRSIFDVTPTTDLCTSGNASTVTGDGPWNWTCGGENGGTTSSCVATKRVQVVNGLCGASNGTKSYNIPTTDLCMSGTSTSVIGNGPWTWTCEGINGGTQENCSVEKKVEGECGESEGKEFYSTPMQNLCAAGASTKVKLQGGIFTWTCKGENTGADIRCNAIKKVKITTSKGGTPNTFTIPENPAVSVKKPPIKEPKEEKDIPELTSAPEDPVKEIVKTIEKVKKQDPIDQEKIDYSKEKGKTLIKIFPELLVQTGTPILDRVKIINSPNVDTSLNQEDFRLAGSNNKDINFWKQVLPDIDKDAEKILVIPNNGLVIPIIGIKDNTHEYQKAINGEDFDYASMLQNGALEFPGTSINGYGEVGNKVIFGHSSFWKDDAGRYKTQFQKIIEMDAGEEIWVYKKNPTGSYTRYVYVTKESYKSLPDNVEVMHPGVGRRLTLITCTPIGGITGRWIVQAEFKEDVEYKQTQNKRNIKLRKYKKIIDKHLNDILNKELPKVEERKILGNIYQQLGKREDIIIDKDIKYVINYFKRKILFEFSNIIEN